jgi:hypothetical protein
MLGQGMSWLPTTRSPTSARSLRVGRHAGVLRQAEESRQQLGGYEFCTWLAPSSRVATPRAAPICATSW